MIISHLEFTNLIVLGESIIVKNRENQCLVKGFTIRYLKNYDRCFSVNQKCQPDSGHYATKYYCELFRIFLQSFFKKGS